MATAPRLLILGGGFVAASACRKLRRTIGAGALDATVVSRENFLAIHGLIGEMITGRITPGSILNPARRIFRPAKVHIAEIESVDLNAQTVVTSRALDGARFTLEYDHLVLALGSAENLEAYPGLAEHAFKLKSFEDCLRLRNHVIEMFELADIEPDPDERRRLLTFVVAGGGFSGTEVAGELADYARLLARREFSGIRPEECRVAIVHPGETLLPELYGGQGLERKVKSFPKLVEFAERHAERLGVELKLGTSVTAASPDDVYLSNGECIPTRTIISTVGTRPTALVDSLPVEKDARGRIVVDGFLRVAGHGNVWAGGDCASVPHPKGGTCPPTALYAAKHGTYLGETFTALAAGRAPKPYRTEVKTQGVSIGRRTAVGEAYGLGLHGKLPWATWRTVLTHVVPTWDRRARLVADWALWPLIGRDIAQIGSARATDYDVHHNVFEPGETIVELRRSGRYVHVLVEGTAVVVRRSDDVEEEVETVGPGSHVGPKWLERRGADAVRATSVVRTVAFRADEGSRLQDILLSTGRLEEDDPVPTG